MWSAVFRRAFFEDSGISVGLVEEIARQNSDWRNILWSQYFFVPSRPKWPMLIRDEKLQYPEKNTSVLDRPRRCHVFTLFPSNYYLPSLFFITFILQTFTQPLSCSLFPYSPALFPPHTIGVEGSNFRQCSWKVPLGPRRRTLFSVLVMAKSPSRLL